MNFSRKYFLAIALVIPFLSKAQLYENRSDLIPNFGGRFAAMDVKAADIDNDGDLDILLANEFQANAVLLNDGSGKLTNETAGRLPQAIHDSEDVIAADFDNDGDLDLIFCSEDDINLGRSNVHEYYLNDGNGFFSRSPFHFTDSEANAVISTDIDGDGNLDVLFGNNGPIGVFTGNGDGTFSEEPNRFPAANFTTQDLLAFDADGDGDTDILEGNENGNVLFINDGSGFFTNATTDRLPLPNIETRKVSAGDADGDGDLDLFLSNVQFIAARQRPNRLYINDGNGVFTDETTQRIPTDFDHTIDGIFEDTDSDGDLDLVIANVFGSPLKVYENDGTGHFSDKTFETLGGSFTTDALGVVAADLNGDGLRDLYFCDRNNGSSNKDLLFLKKKTSKVSEPGKPIVKIFPNPASHGLEIEFLTPQKRHFSLYSSEGQQIFNFGTFYEPKISFPEKVIGHLPKGIYYLKIEAETTTLTEKIVLE